jgi:hypothetical protein
VSEWSDMSTRGLLFQWASTIKKNSSAYWFSTKRTSSSSHWKLTCSRHDIYSWKIAELVLNNNHSLNCFSNICILRLLNKKTDLLQVYRRNHTIAAMIFTLMCFLLSRWLYLSSQIALTWLISFCHLPRHNFSGTCFKLSDGNSISSVFYRFLHLV